MKAIVLAGGKSSRMGQNKAEMLLGNKRMADYATEVLYSIFGEVYISGEAYQSTLAKANIVDVVKEKGPAGGIYSALEFCKEDIFICSCDMPFISARLVQNILRRSEKEKINILKYKDKIYPTLGSYPFSVVKDLKKQIESGNFKMLDFLGRSNVNYIQFEEGLDDELLNINIPASFETAKGILDK